MNEHACCMKSVLEGQETISQEAFSEHLFNYGSGQLHGNNFCFTEPQDTTWAIKYSFVFSELISNIFFPLISFLVQRSVQRSHNAFDSLSHSVHQQCVLKLHTWSLGVVGRDPNSLMYLSVSLASWFVYCCFCWLK